MRPHFWVLVLPAALALAVSGGLWLRGRAGVDRSVAGTIRDLRGADAPAREQAERRLRAAGKPWIPLLVRALERQENFIDRWRTAAHRRSPDSLRRLAPLPAPPESIRESAADALGIIGPPAAAATPALLRALDDPFPEVRAMAIIALGRIDRGASAAGARLVRSLNSRDERSVVLTANALGRIGFGPAAAPLAVRLRDLRPLVRESAARALARLQSRATVAVPPLIAAVNDPEPAVRRAAAEALGKIGLGDPEAITALAGALRDDQLYVRICAAEALGQIGPPASNAIPALVRAQWNDQSGMGAYVNTALREIGRNVELRMPNVE